MLKLAWHFDFHSHREVRIGRRPEPDDIASSLADAGVGEIITFAKGHCGFTYYPTDLTTCFRHPRMEGDPFGQIVHACKARGIRPLAYISFGIDGEGARHHPHWMQQGRANTAPIISPDHFNYVCPYSGYTEECVLPQIDEICRRYPVDGFFFDTMSALHYCYCPRCRESFRQQCGLEIPTDPQDSHWGTYGRFRHDRAMQLLDQVSTFIQQRIPGAAVGFNQVGTISFPQPVPPGCTRLTLDYCTHTPQSRQASRCAAYGSSTPTPADVMPTIFNGGWGDWSVAPAARHEQIAAAIWARRCTVYMGDRMHPDNRLAPQTRTALRQVKAFRDRITPLMPGDDSALSPDVLLLHSESLSYGEDLRYFAVDSRARIKTVDGACDLLLDSGENYMLSPEYCAQAWLEKVQLVVLPELPRIEPATERALHTFAQNGGQVLFIHRLPKVDGGELSWAGVGVSEEPWQDHVYVRLSESAEPTLVRGLCYPTNASAGTQVVTRAIAPFDMRVGIRFGWGISPPADEPSAHVGLSRCAVGNRGGAAWFLAAPLCSSYEAMGDFNQITLLRGLMELLAPRPKARLRHEAADVEVVLHESPESSWAVIVNHGGETMHGSQPGWPRTLGPLPAHDVTLELRGPSGAAPQSVTLDGKAVRGTFNRRENRLRLRLRSDQALRVVKVTW